MGADIALRLFSAQGTMVESQGETLNRRLTGKDTTMYRVNSVAIEKVISNPF